MSTYQYTKKGTHLFQASIPNGRYDSFPKSLHSLEWELKEHQLDTPVEKKWMKQEVSYYHWCHDAVEQSRPTHRLTDWPVERISQLVHPFASYLEGCHRNTDLVWFVRRISSSCTNSSHGLPRHTNDRWRESSVSFVYAQDRELHTHTCLILPRNGTITLDPRRDLESGGHVR